MAYITLTQVQQDLAYLLGEQSPPSTSNQDYDVRTAFIQRALERAYRAYDFPMNKMNATVQASAYVATLPSNVLQDSTLDVREVVSGKQDDHVYRQVEYSAFDGYNTGDYVYYLDGYAGTYNAVLSESDPLLTIRYSSGTPVLNASVGTPFPSSMALARGALIYYRQSEDPQADISQEEALFQGELDEIISSYHRSAPQRRMVARHEDKGTYIGDLGYLD